MEDLEEDTECNRKLSAKEKEDIGFRMLNAMVLHDTSEFKKIADILEKCDKTSIDVIHNNLSTYHNIENVRHIYKNLYNL